MRYRSKGSLVAGTAGYQIGTDGSRLGPFDSGLRYGTLSSISDVVVPRFRQRAAKGEVFFNPCVRGSIMQTLVSAEGYRSRNNSSGVEYEAVPDCTGWLPAIWGKNPDGSLVIPRIVNASDLQGLITEACTSVLSNRGRAPTDSWENLAEMGSTVSMLRHPIASWFKVYRRYGVLQPGMSSAQSVSNAYLMWRYGLSPLIASVEDIMKSLKQMNPAPQRKSTHAQCVDRRTASIAKSGTFGIFVAGTNVLVDHSYKVRATSLDDYVLDLPKALGFDGKSLATLPWQLVKLSFVADWFVNIGDLLGAYADCVSGTRNLGACYTVTEELMGTFTHSTTTSNNSGWSIIKPGSAQVVTLERSVKRYVGLAAPGVTVKSDFRLSEATRVADALALISQLILPYLRLPKHASS